MVEEVMRVALEPVLRDLRLASVAPSRIDDSDWPGYDRAGAMVRSVDSSGLGIAAARSASVVERIASVAQQVQQWAIEQLWSEGHSTNWPRCPRHPSTHPLQATVRAGAAWWTCPVEHVAVIHVGGLRHARYGSANGA